MAKDGHLPDSRQKSVALLDQGTASNQPTTAAPVTHLDVEFPRYLRIWPPVMYFQLREFEKEGVHGT